MKQVLMSRFKYTGDDVLRTPSGPRRTKDSGISLSTCDPFPKMILQPLTAILPSHLVPELKAQSNIMTFHHRPRRR